MLTIWRRHGPGCKHTSRGSRRCSCPIWIEGETSDGRNIKRQSLKTRVWAEAERKKARLEMRAARIAPSVAGATASYLADIERRGLSSSVRGKFKLLLGRLEATHSTRLEAITAEDLRVFAASWGYAPSTARAELERLRQFFRYCVENEWITRNPASAVKPPRERAKPKEPFTKDEMTAILSAADPQARAFCLVMRYSGLRVGDVARLAKDRIDSEGLLTLRTQKTGAVVSVPLPPHVLKALAECPHASKENFFWSGESKRDSVRNAWVDRLARLFKRSGVANAHSHRFRHTFAAELLLRGVPVTDVAMLLGHGSTRTTEKHYSTWIRARQERLTDRVRSTWEEYNSRTNYREGPITVDSKGIFVGAGGGGRTHMGSESRWILSPVRLPIPPLQRGMGRFIE